VLAGAETKCFLLFSAVPFIRQSGLHCRGDYFGLAHNQIDPFPDPLYALCGIDLYQNVPSHGSIINYASLVRSRQSSGYARLG
jgi:hypothetical protein